MLFSSPHLTVFKKPRQFKRRHFRRKHRPFCSVRERSRNDATALAARDVLSNWGQLYTIPMLMSSPGRQDLPLSAVLIPDFHGKGYVPSQGPTCVTLCHPSSLTCAWSWLCRDSLPLEHSSSYLVRIKILKTVKYSEKSAFNFQKTGC